MRSWVLTREATASSAGSTVQVVLDDYSKTATHLVAHRGAGVPMAVGRAETATTAQHVAPASTVATAGSALLWVWVDKVSAPHGWSLPSGVTERAATQGSGGGLVTSVAGGRLTMPSGPVAAVSATAGAPSSKAISWTVVLPPS